MICSHCKRQAADTYRVCPYCGAPVIQFEAAPVIPLINPSLPKKASIGVWLLRWIFFLAVMVVIVTMAVYGFFLFGQNKGDSWRSIVLSMFLVSIVFWLGALYAPDNYRNERNRTLTGKGKVIQALAYMLMGFFLFVIQGSGYFQNEAYRIWTSNGIYSHLAETAEDYIRLIQAGNLAFLLLALVHTIFDKTLQFANTWDKFFGFFKRKRD